jgi:hypothetical protein
MHSVKKLKEIKNNPEKRVKKIAQIKKSLNLFLRIEKNTKWLEWDRNHPCYPVLVFITNNAIDRNI